MQEKVKGILNGIKQRLVSMTKRTKIMLAVGAAAVIIVLIVAVAVMLNQPYAVLFTGLNQSDMTQITSYLSDNGVTDYRVEGNNTILVPQDQEEQLKADLLMEGYPSSGTDYSMYLENVGSLTTESERRQLIQYDLQNRLAGVIRNFDGIRDAAVTISPGEDHTYVLDSSNVVEASAWVNLTLEDGRTLTDAQASAIRSAVSHVVQGLSIDNVTITDQYYNDYTANGSLADAQDLSQLKLALEEQTNNKVRTQIMQVLIPLFGQDNVRVSVNSIVDVDRTYTDSTDYSREEGEDGTIIGDRIYENTIIRGDDGTVGGMVGTPSNADINTYVENELQVQGDEELIQSSGEEHSLVDTQQTQVEHVAGTVADVMVSVTINEAAAGNVNQASLYDHVARAAGIGTDQQNDKISILVSPFYEESTAPITVPDNLLDGWVLYAALGGLGLFLLLLIIILLVRRRQKKKKQMMAEASAAEAASSAAVEAVPVPEGADIMEMKTEKSMELRKDVRKFAEENPEIAAQMVKSWLREGDDAG